MTADPYGGILAPDRGRHRRPEPVRNVHVVLADGRELTLPEDSSLARSIGQIAALLAHW